MKWVDKLNLEISIKEIQSDSKKGKDFCLDPLRFEDLSIKQVRKELIDDIKKQLASSQYVPDKLITVDVPKSNYILRPASRPTLKDWVVYNAIVNFIISKIYKKIPKNSFSFNKFRDECENKYKSSSLDGWISFEKQAVSYSESDKFSLLLTTDITSFFEHISLDALEERLKIFSNDADYVAAVNFLINNMLMRWTEDGRIKKFGLPQGPTASTALADIYLYSLDMEMNKNKICCIRYMDDFRLYSKNKTELKKSIMVLVRALRNLKLNLNAKKTSIFELNNREKLKNVFDPESGRLNLIDKAFKSKKKEQIMLVADYLLELKNLSQTETTFNERYLKYFTGKIIDLMRFDLASKDYIKKLCSEFLENFEEKHHLSNTFCWFFVASSQYNKDLQKIIQSRLIEFVCDKNKNIYEWQEMWALDTIRQIGKLTRKNLNKLRVKYKRSSDLCYAQFALILGLCGNNDDKEEILDNKRINNDSYRATLLSVQELNKDVIRKSGLSVPNYFKLYIESLKGKKYGFNYNLIQDELDSTEISLDY